MISNDEAKKHLIKALKEGVRLDERKVDEFRELKIEYGVSSTAEGSALVTCGDTQILAGVKIELGTPYPDTPDEGGLMVGMELAPIAHEDLESGPPGINAIEISRVIDRGIRESESFDKKKLCVKAGEQVWTVIVDLLPLNHDGNLIDIGGLAALAAIKNAVFPSIKDGVADYKNKTKDKVELEKLPIPVTVIKIGDSFLVDPTYAEEEMLDARLTVTTMDDGRLCAMQKGGDVPLTAEDVEKMVSLAVERGKEIRKLLG